MPNPKKPSERIEVRAVEYKKYGDITLSELNIPEAVSEMVEILDEMSEQITALTSRVEELEKPICGLADCKYIGRHGHATWTARCSICGGEWKPDCANHLTP